MMSTQSAIAVKDHVDSYVAGDPSQSDRHVKALVSAIANRIVTIQDLVEVLEPFLTSDIDTHRSRAGYLLNELLSSPCVSLGAEEVHLFVVFFCHRMKDHASTHISLQAIRSLVVTYGDRFDPSYCDFSFIVGELKHSFQAINHPQPVRMALYGLVVELLRKCFENHVLIHFEDTMGMVISQLEGEKDPRCLLLAFQAIDQLAEQAAKSKEPHDDELGEQVISLLSMYFPIMEFPSYNGDGISVSAEILDALLCRLLCSHSMWAARSLAVFIENMAQSNELISRKKSIECAVAIIQKFGLKTIKSAAFSDNSHLSNLRYLSDFLLEVCFSEGSQELLKCTLSLIEAINFSICTISDFNEGDWNDFQGRFMTDIFREVTSAADSLRSRTAWKVCVSLARSGGCVGTNRILAIVVPFLHQKLQAIWASIQENAVKDPFVSLSHISSAGNVLEMCESLISATVPRDLDSTYYWDCTVAHQLWSTNVLISQFFALVSPTSSPAPSMQGEIVRAIIAALKASKALIKVVGR